MRTINVEDGMPTVAEALTLLNIKLRAAHDSGARIVKVIHGYGSSGKGGKLRPAVRAALLELKEKRRASHVIYGEEWSIFNEETIRVLDRFPEARADRDLDHYNMGITICSFHDARRVRQGP